MLNPRRIGWAAPAALILLAACGSAQEEGDAAAANPCAANPCAANPSAGGGDLDASLIVQGDKVLNTGGHSQAELVALGEKLWNDKSLSGSGQTSCSSCHVGKYAMMNATFAEPFPHYVKMGKDRAGLSEVTAAEMVQLCMIVPMANEPLDWNSVELAALAAYTEDIQTGFDASMAGGGMNPCAANPCAANPCAANPCGANPCAANPCAGK
ncbi:MAG: cytochrome c peroxidase [Gemmatimonadota bacterium]